MADMLFCPAYSTMWTAVQALAALLGVLLGIPALCYSIWSFRRSLETLNYGELDRMYFDLLRVACKNPELTDPTSLQTPEQKARYNIYAFMVWNFLETIYDRCQRDSNLQKTWYPIVETESLLHREWFTQAENRQKFKRKFWKFIDKSKFNCIR